MTQLCFRLPWINKTINDHRCRQLLNTWWMRWRINQRNKQKYRREI